MPSEASTPTAPNRRNIGERITTAMPIEPIIVMPVATSPRAPGRRDAPPGTGSGIGDGSHRGRGRGVRRTVRRHGSPGVAVSAAPPAAGPAARPTRRRLAPSTRTEPSVIVTGSPIGSGPMRPVTRPVSWTNPTVAAGIDVEHAVVGLERVVGDGHRGARRAADHVAPRRELDGRAGSRTGFDDDGHDDVAVGQRDGDRARQRTSAWWCGRRLQAAAVDHTGRAERVVRRHRTAVEVQRRPRVEAEGGRQVGQSVVDRARGDHHPAAAGPSMSTVGIGGAVMTSLGVTGCRKGKGDPERAPDLGQ